MNHTYKLKGGDEEEKKPIEERQIVKEGFVAEFSLVGMKKDFMIYDKTLKELKANRDLKKQTMDNIEQHHPFVKEIPEFDRYTIHMYQEAAASYKAFDKKIAETEAEEADYRKELEEIQTQIPALAPIVSPYMQNSDEEVVNKGEIAATPSGSVASGDCYCHEKGCESELIPGGDSRFCDAHAQKNVEGSEAK